MGKKINSTVITFSDLDLFSFNKLAIAWHLDLIQLRPGRFSANLSQIICDECQLGYAKFNTAVKQEGVSPPGVWTFAFANEIKLYWRNYKVQPRSIIIYAPGSEINAVSEANFEVLTFSISEELLRTIAEEANVEDLLETLRSKEVVTTKDPLCGALRKGILLEIKKHQKKQNAQIDMEFVASFIKGLLGLIRSSTIPTEKVSRNKRLELLKNAEQYIKENISEAISVSEIASKFGVSERTLLYAFKNRFEMGPKAFIKSLQLNHVHHTLHGGKDIASISAIARASGFWHLGQFYKDYKKFFGELPSDTLRKNVG